jgi:hypothetical protein
MGGSQGKEEGHSCPPRFGKVPLVGERNETQPNCQKKSEEKRMREAPMAENGRIGNFPRESQHVHIRENGTKDAEKPEKGSPLPRQESLGSDNSQKSMGKSGRHSLP